MQVCYDNNATFHDPVFTSLNATQVRAMWEMFCLRGNDLVIDTSRKYPGNWKDKYGISARRNGDFN